jgi:alpha-galactosidase
MVVKAWPLLALVAWGATAEARITAPPGARQFRLDGGGVTYAFGLDEAGIVQPLYWGRALDAAAPLATLPRKELISFDPASGYIPQEYAGQGAGLVTDPAVKAVFPDGNRDLVLHYVSHRVVGDRLDVELADISRPFAVTLHYAIDERTGILTRSATVRNTGRTPVRLDQVMAATFTLPVNDDYRLHSLSGRWGAEWTQTEQKIGPADIVTESRRGSTSHEANPWFQIDRTETGEQHGPVWFGALAWSGSWRLSVGEDDRGRTHVAAGWNPYDFSWTLKAGETLDTPLFYAGYTDTGRDGAARLLGRFARTNVMPGGDAAPLRPVLYNSWEATQFAVNEPGQIALAERAAKLGVERFVIDDGWFGQRNSDNAGLGDWTVNPAKFPNGLKPLIDRVHALGMSFGLWVEPEMVNPDSDLFRTHPDWAMQFPGRPRTEARQQLVLNLARTDVRDHLLAVLDKLLVENDIQFLKWDYNRNWTEPGWAQMPVVDQQRISVQFVRNLYYIMGELRRRHPGLEIETCSGGGGRVDLGILALTDEAWTSDNTDPFDRLTIQDGFVRAYPTSAMMAWVTDSPNFVNGRVTSMDYRFLSSMQGSLGVGANLSKLGDADLASAAKWIAAYKEVRRTIQRGDRFRLIPPQGNETTATLFVSADRSQAVLFQMLHSSSSGDNPAPIRAQGLDEARTYRIRMLGSDPLPAGVPAQASGAWLMGQGLRAPLKGDYQGAAFVFEAAS